MQNVLRKEMQVIEAVKRFVNIKCYINMYINQVLQYYLHV